MRGSVAAGRRFGEAPVSQYLSVPLANRYELRMRSVAFWLTIAFVFTIPWENAIQIGEFGRVSKGLGFIMAAVWAGSVLVRGWLRPLEAFQKAYFVFLVWGGLSIYWSIDSPETLRGFLTMTQIFILLLIIWDLFDSEHAIRVGLQAYVLGALITTGGVLYAYLTVGEVRFAEHQRYQALSFETDGIALILAIAAPAAWYLATSPSPGRPSPLRLVNYAYVPLALFALILTGTRGATIASIPTALFVLWSLRRAGPSARLLAFGAIGVALAMVLWFAPREPLARIGTAVTVTDLSGGALSGRWHIWTQSTQAFLDRPIAGAGVDAHRAAVQSRLDDLTAYKKAEKEAHNTYLSVLVETGLVGLFLFATIIVIVFTRVRQFARWQAWYWSAQLAVLAIGAMSLSLEDSKSVWIFVAFCVGSAALVESRVSSFDTWHTPALADDDVGSTYRRNGQGAVPLEQPVRPWQR
jgi:O-antigen ligase